MIAPRVRDGPYRCTLVLLRRAIGVTSSLSDRDSCEEHGRDNKSIRSYSIKKEETGFLIPGRLVVCVCVCVCVCVYVWGGGVEGVHTMLLYE